MTSVDVFGIISGYLGISKEKYTLNRVVELLFIVVFYSIAITFLFILFLPGQIDGARSIIKGLVPMLVGRYWYITCYIPLFLLQPWINKMVLSLSIEQHKKLCTMLIIIFGLIPSISRINYFGEDGYSVSWLIICYVIGAFLRRSNCKGFENEVRNVAWFFSLAMILLCINTLITLMVNEDWRYLVSYFSPIIVLMSICFVSFFVTLKIKWSNALFKRLSAVTFDVYIIHAHIFVYQILLTNRFMCIGQLSLPLSIVSAVGLSIIIYICLSLVGIMRQQLFRKLGVNTMVAKICEAFYKVKI